jgi:hypothetical protein
VRLDPSRVASRTALRIMAAFYWLWRTQNTMKSAAGSDTPPTGALNHNQPRSSSYCHELR